MGLPRRHFRHGENGSRLRLLEISRSKVTTIYVRLHKLDLLSLLPYWGLVNPGRLSDGKSSTYLVNPLDRG